MLGILEGVRPITALPERNPVDDCFSFVVFESPTKRQNMWIVHSIAFAALICGSLIAYVAAQGGASTAVLIAWPLGMLVSSYVVSIVVCGFAAGGPIRNLKIIFLGLLFPKRLLRVERDDK